MSTTPRMSSRGVVVPSCRRPVSRPSLRLFPRCMCPSLCGPPYRRSCLTRRGWMVSCSATHPTWSRAMSPRRWWALRRRGMTCRRGPACRRMGTARQIRSPADRRRRLLRRGGSGRASVSRCFLRCRLPARRGRLRRVRLRRRLRLLPWLHRRRPLRRSLRRPPLGRRLLRRLRLLPRLPLRRSLRHPPLGLRQLRRRGWRRRRLPHRRLWPPRRLRRLLRRPPVAGPRLLRRSSGARLLRRPRRPPLAPPLRLARRVRLEGSARRR